ncbi:MAG: peroxiredoxin-like family protein [Verrucomicrobiota bacterium]
MSTNKIEAGAVFPEVTVNGLDGVSVDIGQPSEGSDWKMVVVYRGRHCPLCTKYLNSLEAWREPLAEIGVDLAAVSGDSREQLESHLEKLDVSFPLYYGLTLEQMQRLGLYISHPRSEQETDHPFAEPGLFVINADHQVQVVDLSNNPFVRPELEPLVSGLTWIRNPENNYPIRGTYSEAGAS